MREYVARGFEVIAFDREPPPEDAGEHVYHHTVDVSDDVALARLVATCAESFGIRHVVGIAGGALPADDGDSGWGLPDVKVFRESVEQNLTSQYCLVHAALPALRTGAGDRTISFCSSINALGAWARPSYSAAKAGLLGLTRILADRLAEDGIRVNCVAPGSVLDTQGRIGREDNAGLADDLNATIPLGRPATPQDVARAFTAVALDLTHMTGQTLVLDGGQEIRRLRRQ